jgi:hypothetical protein
MIDNFSVIIYLHKCCQRMEFEKIYIIFGTYSVIYDI